MVREGSLCLEAIRSINEVTHFQARWLSLPETENQENDP